jgi:L-fuconolactonase
MIRIDAHHHLWRYDADAFGWITPGSAIARDFDGGDLIAAMATRGVDAAIAVQARQEPGETRALLDAAPLLVGYRHLVQDEADAAFLLGDAMVRGVRAVATHGLTYDLLIDHRQLATVPDFLDRVGTGRFVLDHAAKPAIATGGWQPWADRLAAVAACPQVMCKVSGLVTEADHATWSADDLERYLDHVFASFGAGRVMWGSDWPVCLLAADYAQAFDVIADYVVRHCPGDEAAIFGGNALRAYGLHEGAAR